jgi:hypothetical protein
MERRRTEIRHRELEPLPEVEVYYTPETQTLSIQNGLRVKDGEEMARGLTAFYDAEGSLVAIDLESAELLSNRSWMLSGAKRKKIWFPDKQISNVTASRKMSFAQ